MERVGDAETRSGTVLVVDDDPAVRTVLAALIAQAEIEALSAASAEEALRLLEARPIDVVVTDLRMPKIDGLELLGRIKEHWPSVQVVVLTAHGTIPLAVEAMRAGAADFILKPFDRDEIIFIVRKALRSAEHADRVEARSAPISAGGFVSRSPRMTEAIELIALAAKGTATVLIRGESGTGKELAARALHDLGPRKKGPFLAIHCAALPETLLESELFGYEKGAFTGAAARKPGRFELASGGTLFLDEIGEISPQVQVKLLRVLQERRLERLGGTESVSIDVRIVAATHRDLEAMVEAGEFRGDLYYRLDVVPIWMPPLRERADDIEPLALELVATLGPLNGRQGIQIDPDAIARLAKEPWPGNVRQLQNFIERLIALSKSDRIGEADVLRELARSSATPKGASPAASLEAQRSEAEKEAIKSALEKARGNRSLAARLLNVSRRTLYNKLAEHHLE